MKPTRSSSLATVVALLALAVSLTGTTYAATGGNFLLGRANKADQVTKLANPNGTALSLSSKAGTPPLQVNSDHQVPKLNASQLGGKTVGELAVGFATAETRGPAVGFTNGQTGFLNLWGGPGNPMELGITKKRGGSCLMVSYSASNFVTGATGSVSYGIYVYDATDTPQANNIDPWFYNLTNAHQAWSGTVAFPGLPAGQYTIRLRVGSSTGGVSVVTDLNDHASLTAIEVPAGC